MRVFHKVFSKYGVSRENCTLFESKDGLVVEIEIQMEESSKERQRGKRKKIRGEYQME